jgi:hypothetical protein
LIHFFFVLCSHCWSKFSSSLNLIEAVIET